jgi:hypothetical protein
VLTCARFIIPSSYDISLHDLCLSNLIKMEKQDTPLYKDPTTVKYYSHTNCELVDQKLEGATENGNYIALQVIIIMLILPQDLTLGYRTPSSSVLKLLIFTEADSGFNPAINMKSLCGFLWVSAGRDRGPRPLSLPGRSRGSHGNTCNCLSLSSTCEYDTPQALTYLISTLPNDRSLVGREMGFLARCH